MTAQLSFNLIVETTDRNREEEAAGALAQALGLDPEVARAIVRGAPIVLVRGLTKQEVRALTPALQRVSQSGVEFRITARSTGTLPAVNWPVRPQFTAFGSGGPHAVAFQWNGSAFVCPSCGETFLFQRLGKLPLGPSVVEAPTTTAAGSSAQLPAVPATPAPKAASPKPPPAPAKPAPKSAANPAPAPAPGPAAEDLGLEVPELADWMGAEAGERQEPAAAALDDLDRLLAEGGPSGVGGEPDVGALDLESDIAAEAEGLIPIEGLDEELAGTERAQAAAGGLPEAPPGEGYNVFVLQIKEKQKREEAAKLIAEMRGIDIREALQLTSRTMFAAAKNVTKQAAENLADRLRKLKISARVTKGQ